MYCCYVNNSLQSGIMIRSLAIASIVAGLSLPSNGFATPLEEMSGTSFAANRSEQPGNAPLLSLALRAGLLGLGLVVVRRVVPFTNSPSSKMEE